MKNQYALLVQVPQKNLRHFTYQINSGYTNYFNRHHKYRHRVFGENFKYFIIDEKNFLVEVSFYLHLLPKIAEEAKSLLRFGWSSLPGYIDEDKKEGWIDYNCVLSLINDEGEVNPTLYKTRLVCRMREKIKSPFDGLDRGEILRDNGFKQKIQEKLGLEENLLSKNDSQKNYTDLNNHNICLLFKPLKKSSISKMSLRYRNFYETEPSSRKAVDILVEKIRRSPT